MNGNAFVGSPDSPARPLKRTIRLPGPVTFRSSTACAARCDRPLLDVFSDSCAANRREKRGLSGEVAEFLDQKHGTGNGCFGLISVSFRTSKSDFKPKQITVNSRCNSTRN
jgi:hypothetical protein